MFHVRAQLPKHISRTWQLLKVLKHGDQAVARFWTAAKAEKERFDRERAECPTTCLSDDADFCDVKNILDAVVFAVAEMPTDCGLGGGLVPVSGIGRLRLYYLAQMLESLPDALRAALFEVHQGSAGILVIEMLESLPVDGGHRLFLGVRHVAVEIDGHSSDVARRVCVDARTEPIAGAKN